MKKFLKKISVYSVLFIVISFIILFIEQTIIRNNASFTSINSPTTGVFGNSHPVYAFNDSLIVGLSNFSDTGESYFYTLPKLKGVLQENPSLQTIFLEFENGYINKRREKKIWGEKYLSKFYDPFAPFIPIKDQLIIVKHNPLVFLKNAPGYGLSQTERIILNDLNYKDKIGGYKSAYTSKIDSLKLNYDDFKKNIDSSHYTTKDFTSSYSYHYLNEIIELTNQYNVQLYFIRTPIHNYHVDLRNESAFKNIYNTYFKQVPLLDFKNFPLSDQEFRDFGHLNSSGAKKFSRWFNKLLQEGLLDQPDKQKYINKNFLNISS